MSSIRGVDGPNGPGTGKGADSRAILNIDSGPSAKADDDLGRVFEVLGCRGDDDRQSGQVFIDTDGIIASDAGAVISAEIPDLCLSRATAVQPGLGGKQILRVSPELFARATDFLSSRHNPAVHPEGPLSSPVLSPPSIEEMILAAAGNMVSDIHLEPTPDGGYTVRERRDGRLGPRLPGGGPSSLIKLSSRIRVLSRLPATPRPIEEARFEVSGVEVRASMALTPTGLFITLRLFNPMPGGMDTQGLNLDPVGAAALKRALSRPAGLVVFSGPTGSGKTTAAFAAAAEFIDPSRRLVTVEDPVEIKLDGAMQIDCGVTGRIRMDEALKTILRHDPDVIIIGEIRDRDSAVSAVELASTGHLVLTTVHGLGPAGAIRRMTALGADPAALAEALLMVVDLRLVGRVSPSPSGLTRTCVSNVAPMTPLLVGTLVGTLAGSLAGAHADGTSPGSAASLANGLAEAAGRLVNEGIISMEEVERWL